jgi:sulfur carrier protein
MNKKIGDEEVKGLVTGKIFMNITVNGKSLSASDTLTVQELLDQRSLNGNHVVVEVNEVIIPKEDFGGRCLFDHDTVEILRFVGGG